nr:DUF3688 family protein [Spiroplasma sp. ChiS]
MKLQNFNNILLSENINDKLQFDKLLNSMFKISQKFYTNYLRTIFGSIYYFEVFNKIILIIYVRFLVVYIILRFLIKLSN